MVLYPIWSLIDVFVSPGSHTLLGLEIILYIAFGVGTGITALIGYWAGNLFRKLINTDS
jgi:hypothetical protein